MDGWKVISDVEGYLSIKEGLEILFEEDNMLLLEFAKSLNEWRIRVNTGEVVSLKYYSMDVEEGPLLTFEKDKGKSWIIRSVWSNKEFAGTTNELLKICGNFIDGLVSDLKSDGLEVGFPGFAGGVAGGY